MGERLRRSPRERLVAILRALGVRVDLHNIRDTRGAERRADCARWGSVAQPLIPLQAAAGPWSNLFYVYSWDTMTECARRGMQIVVDGTEIEAHALPAAQREARP